MRPEAFCLDINECLPIDSIDEVIRWKKPQRSWATLIKPIQKRAQHCTQSYPVCSKNSKSNIKKSSDVPKTLVCHDMKGGYGSDRWVNGTDNPEEYKFLMWSCIDTFVYFSHRLVTIPPLCWINAGHVHGVKVLGTLITEGKHGTAIWENLSHSVAKLSGFAVKLAEICHHYGFDGYLINIENSLSYKSMESFLLFFQKLVKQLKNVSPEIIVIWYDAVTYPFGKLWWQNKLNQYNKKFFDLCDGIFLNYGWSEEDLVMSALEAGARITDVYVGIDVFGRGNFGGGGFRSFVAMNVIRKYGLSAAIFAPGWVFENCKEGELVDVRDFMFWELLMEYLYCYGPTKLPFQTSFCRGYGLRKYKKGLIVNDRPWFSLSEMNHLPALLSGIDGIEDSCCFMYHVKEAYDGGGCLLIKHQKTSKTEDHSDRLFICDFYIQKEKNIIVKVVSKPLLTDCDSEMNIILNLVDHKDPIKHSEETVEKQISLPIKYESSANLNKWLTSEFNLDIVCAHIASIDCSIIGNSSPVLLGYFSIEDKDYVSRRNEPLSLEETVSPTYASSNVSGSCPGISLVKYII